MKNSLIKLMTQMIDKGLVPDFIIRLGIRSLLRSRLSQMQQLESENNNDYIKVYANELKKFPLAILTEQANKQHYEVPTEFYHLCLGPQKKYSSCFWEASTQGLADAEKKALDISIQRADITDGMTILELGCGWGSLSLELARRFPNSKIIAVSNSKTQKEFIDTVAQKKGFSNLQILTRDLGNSENYDFLGLKFDRVMSIEMMEHLRNYELFFKLVSEVMKPEARFFIHIFTHKKTPYFFETEGDDNWMGQYFFSGGQMPAKELFANFNNNLIIDQTWTWNGRHYQKTLESWLQLMDKNLPKIKTLFNQAYGPGQSEMWINRWRVFYMSCSELFGYNKGSEWDVTHYLLRKR